MPMAQAGALCAKVLKLSAKTKYENETPPHAVFDLVSAGVSTYYQIYNKKTRLLSGSWQVILLARQRLSLCLHALSCLARTS